MTDTPKDRDDEAVAAFAQFIATAMGEGLHGASPSFKRVAEIVLSGARSAGYIVARPAALRDQVTNLHRRAQKAEGTLDRYKRKGGQRHWFDFAVRQRNRALKAEAERDAARAALAEAEKRCETMREALEPFANAARFSGNSAILVSPPTFEDLRRAHAATGG